MERFKNYWIAFSGMLFGFLFVMCAVGSTAWLVTDGHYVFAVATLATSCFAAKPVKEYFIKTVVM
jgi:hypothetical protein